MSAVDQAGRCPPIAVTVVWSAVSVIMVGALYRTAVAAEEVQAGQLYDLGRQAFQRGEFGEAIDHLEAATRADSGNSAYRLLLGRAYAGADRLSDARRCFRAVIRLEPDNPTAPYRLGEVYLRQKRYALAIDALDRARRLGIESPELHYHLATAYYKLQNCTGDFQTRVVIDGQAGRIEAGVFLIEPVANEPMRFVVAPRDSALYQVHKALDGGLDEPEVRLLQADIWLCARRYSTARDIYATLQDSLPAKSRPAYEFSFAKACRGMDDLDGYLQHLRRAVALEPETYRPLLGDAYRHAAERCSSDGDLDDYIRYLRLATDETPVSPELHYLLGNALHEGGRKTEASRHWRITLELQPDHGDRLRMLELIRAIGSQAGDRKAGGTER